MTFQSPPSRCLRYSEDPDSISRFDPTLRSTSEIGLGVVLRLSVLVMAIGFGSGCQEYHPKPLNNDAIARGLAMPDHRDLQVKIAELKNPLLSPVQFRPDQGLTPDQAAVMAVVVNPALRAQRDARGLSQASLLQAGLLPNPQLTFTRDWNIGGGLPGNINPYGVGVNYDVTALISHAAKKHSAEYAAQSVDLNIAWQEWQVAQSARIACYDLISQQSQRSLLTQVDQRLADNLKVIQQAADAGLKTGLDLAAAESASRDAHAAVLQADRDLEHQRLQLNRAIGFPPETKIDLKKDQGLPTGFSPPTIESLVQNLQTRRLDLVALKQGYQSQEQTLVAAMLEQFPRINLGFNRAVDNSNVRSIGLGVNIDIPLFDRNQGNIAIETANRQRLFDEYVSRVFDARADIAAAVADIHAINEQIRDVQAALPNLKKLVEVYKQAVDHGSADVLSYYTAWNALSQKNLDLLKLQQQLVQNRAALEIASGRYFPDDLPHASTQPATVPAADSGAKP